MAILATLASSIEGDKENIKPSHHGRSAAKLDQLLHTERSALQKQLAVERAQFEESLKSSELQDLDDPIEPYLRYIKWIRESYPSGSNDSLLIQVLERTTHDFKDDDYYRNEIRYFRIWLEYITYSDHPGEVYSYLLKKQIGSALALFYENYSHYFELNDQWERAEAILKLGITNDARPQKRLMKSYKAFLERKELKSSILTSTVPSAVKGLSNPEGSGLNTTHTTKNTKTKPKLQVFKDNDEAKETRETLGFTRSRQNDCEPHFFLDSVKNSKKENVLNPTSWAGQTLKSNTNRNSSDRDALRPKLEVFNEKTAEYPITKTVKNQGKPDEIYDLNLELFLPSNEKPRSMMEVLIMFQNCKVEEGRQDDTLKRASSTLFTTPVHKKIKKEDFSNNNTTNVEDSPCDKSPQALDTPLLEYFKNSKGGIFSRDDEKDDVNAVAAIDQFNATSANTLANQNSNFNSYNNYANCLDPPDDANNLLDDIIGGKFSDIFADTVTKSLNGRVSLEKEELVSNRLDGNTENTQLTKNCKDEDNEEIVSSPFVENPNKIISGIPEDRVYLDPFSQTVRDSLLSVIRQSLFKDARIHDMISSEMNKLFILQTIFPPNSPSIYGNKEAILEFEKGDLHCIIKSIGQKNNLSKVFLSEKIDGKASAIKISSPPEAWEAYILSKINKTSNDFIKIQSFYQYKDESYMVLPYFKQGNITELVDCLGNYQFLTGKNLIEETLIFYLTIQILSNIIKLHSLGFIHCNIRPEHFLLDLHSSCNNNKVSFNDLALIDFSRSIDLSLHPPNSRFKCGIVKSEPGCCPEFTEHLPWLFEPDYHGVANVIHFLLFNKPIKLKKADHDKVELVEPIKRYWQTELWNELFNVLLNPRAVNSEGIVINELKQIRSKFESWFNLTVDKRMFLAKLRNISEILDTRFKKGSKC